MQSLIGYNATIAFTLSDPVSDILELENSKFPTKQEIDIYAPVSFDMQSILVNHINDFSDIPVLQWEKSGYSKPTQKVFENIVSFITSLPNYYLIYLNQDNVIPSPYGTLVLDFERLEKKISIEISENKLGVIKEFPKEGDFLKDFKFTGNKIPHTLLKFFEKFIN